MRRGKWWQYASAAVLGCLLVAVVGLWLVTRPTPEEKELIKLAEDYCMAVTSAETIHEAYALTDKGMSEEAFCAHVVDKSVLVRNKILGAEIHEPVGTVAIRGYYASGENKVGYLFFKRINGQWKIELPRR